MNEKEYVYQLRQYCCKIGLKIPGDYGNNDKTRDPLYIQLFTALKLTLLIQCRQNVSECCLVACYMLLLLMSVEAEALIAPSAAFVINAVLVIGTADQPADHE